MSTQGLTIDSGALVAALARTAQTWLDQITPAIAAECQATNPERSGNLRDHTTWRIDGLTGTVTADTPYAAAVNKGARPHTITARRVRVLRFPGQDGKPVFRRSVNHPGNEPNPYMDAAVKRIVGR